MEDRICINGRYYIAEDALPKPSKPEDEPYELVVRLCKEYDIDVHRANNAINAGELDARLPKGQKRGRKCRRSEFVRWLEESMVRCA